MKAFLIKYRDYCFNELKHRNGETYAYESYKFLFAFTLFVYYAAFVAFVAIIQYKLDIPVPHALKHGLGFFLSAILYIYLYYLLVKWIFKKLDQNDINENFNNSQLKSMRWKAILIYLFGMSLIVLIPWSLDRLIQ